MTYKLGKLPAREGAYRFKLADYLTTPLPAAPAVFGHQALVKTWGMNGNDTVGDCVLAGAAHETILWNDEAGTNVDITTANSISDYSAVTGYNPADPNSDQGTDMQAAASYRRKTGIIDANGNRHKVDAYLELPGVSARGANQPSLLNALASATYLFGAVGIGIQFPSSAMDQFDSGQPWDVVDGSPIEGGHYIPIVGRAANGDFLVVTWGQVQAVTPAFLLKYVDEAIAYVSLEALKSGQTLEGFNVSQLDADLTVLGNGTTPTPQPVPTPAPTPTPLTPFQIAALTLDPWANKRHCGSNAAAAAAWKTYRATQ